LKAGEERNSYQRQTTETTAKNKHENAPLSCLRVVSKRRQQTDNRDNSRQLKESISES
jgi:hypothetical protein